MWIKVWVGEKTLEWNRERKKLVKIYEEKGITSCEFPQNNCAGGLGFHHFDKRSSGKAEHTFEGTCLVCNKHHDICEYNKDMNEMMRKRRLFYL